MSTPQRCGAKSGIAKESRIGYAAGLNYPPDWGLEISESFRIRERGAETFADFPRQLFVKP